MQIPFVPPEYRKTSFNCPYCSAFANQNWYTTQTSTRNHPELQLCFCSHCGQYSIWHNGQMLYPENSGIEPPNPDLDEEIQKDYMEAGSIVNKSPRGAAALLRLCVQKLCRQLGETGKDLNEDIASLVRKGLNARIQQALDIVRVIGNEAVHPGQIDLHDDLETANQLFRLVNFIAYSMLTQPKEIEKLYAGLPDSKKAAIEQRDKKG